MHVDIYRQRDNLINHIIMQINNGDMDYAAGVF